MKGDHQALSEKFIRAMLTGDIGVEKIVTKITRDENKNVTEIRKEKSG